MGYKTGIPKNLASYIVITGKEKGYDIEKVFVEYDREKMINSIYNSKLPYKDLIAKYSCVD